MNEQNSDLVSIVTPAYNSARFIAETIQSVQKQTHQNWEMLIVADKGTTDNTAEIVQKFSNSDNRIKYFLITDKKGVSAARNKALDEAKGEYIAFLDSDDVWLPEKLSRQLKFMKDQLCEFSFTGYRRFRADQVGKYIAAPAKLTYEDILKNNRIPCPTVLFKQQSETREIRLVEHPHEEYIYWLKLIKFKKSAYGLNEDLARYRIVENSRSMRVNRGQSRWFVYRNFEKLSAMKSLYYLSFYAITALVKRLRF